MKVSSNLFAGAGANVGSADGGALSFNVAAPPLFEAWYNGSALSCEYPAWRIF